MLDVLSWPSVAVPVLLLAYLLYSSLFRSSTKLPDLPLLNGRPGEWFSPLRSRWRNATGFKAALTRAYAEYSKKDRSFIAHIVSFPEVIVLPPSLAGLIAEQSIHVLSSEIPHIEDLQTDYTLPDPMLVRNPTHHHVINRDLTPKLGYMVSEIVDEASRDLEERWGMNTEEWKDVPVFDSMKKCIGRAINRVFVGIPLCRNQQFLDAGIAFAQDVPLTSKLINLFPKISFPVVGPLLTIPNKIHTRIFFKHLIPEVKKQLEAYDRKQADSNNKDTNSDREDYLQWTINYAKKSGQLSECEPRTIAGRILMLNFAAVHTTTLSLTHVLYDLATSDPSYISELRDEIISALSSNPPKTHVTSKSDLWTKSALSQMIKLDSTLRESNRVNSFTTIALLRYVVSPSGFTTPQGVHCPQGSLVGVPGYGIHHDQDIWGADADEFKPFRFAERRDGLLNTTTGGGSGSSSNGENTVSSETTTKKESHIRQSRLAFSTTALDFLAWGHGRYACPGRFLAATELKLLLAWIILHYDIDPLPSRPEDTWFGLLRLPDMKARIRLRRRKEDVPF